MITEWQPIKTAPKDGTEVLVGKYVNGEWRVCQVGWHHFPGCDNPIQGYEPDVWWWNEDADWGGITDDEGPTHWQPLSAPSMPVQDDDRRRANCASAGIPTDREPCRDCGRVKGWGHSHRLEVN